MLTVMAFCTLFFLFSRITLYNHPAHHQVYASFPKNINILIPLYSYPNWWSGSYIWDDIASTSRTIIDSHKPLTVTAIINPGNGPGDGPPNTDYTRGINELKNAGVKMLGYVYSSYGNRNRDEVKNDIAIYHNSFAVQGFFIDEMASGTDKINYYTDLYSYIKSLDPDYEVFGNPGQAFDESYLYHAAADAFVIFENNAGNWLSFTPPSFLSSYDKKYAALIHSAPASASTLPSLIDLAYQRNIDYLFITNDVMDNPWDTLPPFWQGMADYLVSKNQVFTLTLTPTLTPTSTPTHTPTPTSTPASTPTPSFIPTFTPTPSPTLNPSPTVVVHCPQDCPIPPGKNSGDADCNGVIDENDFGIFIYQYIYQKQMTVQEKTANFYCLEERETTHEVNLDDFAVWRDSYLNNANP